MGQDTGAADLASVSEQRESVPWRTRGAPPLDGCVRAWRETSASLPPAVKGAPLVADCCAANQHRLAGPNQHRRAPHGLEVRNPNALLPEALGEHRSFTFPPPRGARNPPVPHPVHLQSRQWPAEPLSAASPRPGLPLTLRRRGLVMTLGPPCNARSSASQGHLIGSLTSPRHVAYAVTDSGDEDVSIAGGR